MALTDKLTAIADAIRAKTGGTDTLTLDQMAETITTMETDSTNFEIVGGTEEPANPKENTIWVNTDTAIGEWQFSATEPTKRVDGTELQSGDIWVEMNNTSETFLNLLKKNSVRVGTGNVSQWNGTNFEYKTSKVWVNETWVETGRYWIHNPGVLSKLNKSWAIAYQGTSSTPISISIDSSSGNIKSTGNFYYHSAVDSAKHSLSNYTKAYVEIIDGNSKGSIGFYTGRASGKDQSLSFPQASASLTAGLKEIDISSLTGEYYFGYTSDYGASSDTLVIGNIYLR